MSSKSRFFSRKVQTSSFGIKVSIPLLVSSLPEGQSPLCPKVLRDGRSTARSSWQHSLQEQTSQRSALHSRMCVCVVEEANSSIQEHPRGILGASPKVGVTLWTSFWLCERWVASLSSTPSPSSWAHSALLQIKKGKETRVSLSQARSILCIIEGGHTSSYFQVPAAHVVLPFRRSFKTSWQLLIRKYKCQCVCVYTDTHTHNGILLSH